ncbi:MAG: hypothetical protein DBY17_00990 [Oscillospiraceae bacterium]|nr:MAG: hypothetical protein DBY17_00990 [Oscillospiraceae bacterium]
MVLAAERSAVLQSNVPACSRHNSRRRQARFCKATYPLAAGRPQKLPLLRQKNYPARQRKAGLPRNLDAEDEKPPMAGLMAAMGGLPMWRAEMTARPNHCFPARPRLCRGRFFDMYPPVVKLRRTFFASFSFFVESNLYEATRGLCKAAAPPHPGHSGPVRHMQASKGLIPASGTPFPRAWGVLPQSIATGRAGGFHLQTEKPG